MNQTVKTILVWVLILSVALGLWNLVEKKSSSTPIISLTDFMDKVTNGSVAEVTINGPTIRGRLRSDNQEFQSTMLPGYTAVYEKLIDAKVSVTVVPDDRSSLAPLMSWLMPVLVAFGLGWLCASWFQRRRPQPPMTA